MCMKKAREKNECKHQVLRSGECFYKMPSWP